MKVTQHVALLSLILAFFCSVSVAQTSANFTLIQSIDLSTKTEQSFGTNVVISADQSTLVVSAPTDGKSITGSVYVYQLNSTGQWAQVTELIPTTTLDSEAGYGYGLAVSGNGSVIVVGAPNQSSKNGLVIVFFQTGATTWEQFTTLTYKTGRYYFGSVVDVSSDGSIIVATGAQEGYACFFSKITFGYNQTACYHTGGGYYIDSIYGLDAVVSPDGSTIAVITTIINTGAVQIYSRQENGDFDGSQIIVVGPSATSLAFSNDGLTLAVGSSTVDLNRADGTVFIYRRSSDSTRFFLHGNSSQPALATTALGASLALNDDGSFLIASNPISAAFSYSSSSDLLTYVQTFLMPTSTACFYWANSISLATDTSLLFIGCPQYGSSTRSGIVYVYSST